MIRKIALYLTAIATAIAGAGQEGCGFKDVMYDIATIDSKLPQTRMVYEYTKPSEQKKELPLEELVPQICDVIKADYNRHAHNFAPDASEDMLQKIKKLQESTSLYDGVFLKDGYKKAVEAMRKKGIFFRMHNATFDISKVGYSFGQIIESGELEVKDWGIKRKFSYVKYDELCPSPEEVYGYNVPLMMDIEGTLAVNMTVIQKNAEKFTKDMAEYKGDYNLASTPSLALYLKHYEELVAKYGSRGVVKGFITELISGSLYHHEPNHNHKDFTKAEEAAMLSELAYSGKNIPYRTLGVIFELQKNDNPEGKAAKFVVEEFKKRGYDEWDIKDISPGDIAQIASDIYSDNLPTPHGKGTVKKLKKFKVKKDPKK